MAGVLVMVESSVKVLGKSDSRIRILLEGYPLHVLSSIRRAAMEEVPTIAIDTLFIVENNSVIHDENLAHRMAMVPLDSEKAIKKYRSPEECSECPTCEDCYTRIVLDVRNDEEEEKVVYSGDMQIEDPDIKPVYENIPIVVLGKGQSVSLEAQARLGRGKEHIKWSPTTVSVLTYLPVLVFDLNGLDENTKLNDCLDCIAKGFPDLAEKMKKTRKGELLLHDVKNTSFLRFCVEKVCGGEQSPLKIKYLENSLILTIESSGALRPETIIMESIKVLKEKINTFRQELSKQVPVQE